MSMTRSQVRKAKPPDHEVVEKPKKEEEEEGELTEKKKEKKKSSNVKKKKKNGRRVASVPARAALHAKRVLRDARVDTLLKSVSPTRIAQSTALKELKGMAETVDISPILYTCSILDLGTARLLHDKRSLKFTPSLGHRFLRPFRNGS